jgi:chaperonin GroES
MIKPLQDMIVVKPDPAKKHDFLVLPDEDVHTGVVMAAGPGKKLPNGNIRRMLVNAGDHVMYSGTIDLKHGDYLLMRDKDVIGLV